MAEAHRPMPLNLSEAEFARTVVDYAKRRGWHCFHAPVTSPRPGRYMTAGGVGFPDWIFARAGVVLVVELKRFRAKATPAQMDWLAAAGDHARLWTPQHWPTILEELR